MASKKVRIIKPKIKQTKAKVIKPKTKPKPITINHSGAFTAYCKRKGYKGVTCACIREGLHSKDPHVRRMANFARNFGHRNCKV
jgi:hypothetical protein